VVLEALTGLKHRIESRVKTSWYHFFEQCWLALQATSDPTSRNFYSLIYGTECTGLYRD
jgi:hypothetical protein